MLVQGTYTYHCANELTSGLRLSELGKRRLCSVEVALERQRSGKPVEKSPITRACGTPLNEQIYRLIHWFEINWH